jgi:hypothetical protein
MRVIAALGWTCSTFTVRSFETNRPPRLARRSVPTTTPSSVARPTVVVPVFATASSSAGSVDSWNGASSGS